MSFGYRERFFRLDGAFVSVLDLDHGGVGVDRRLELLAGLDNYEPGPDERNAAVPDAALREDHLVLHAGGVGQLGDLVRIGSRDTAGGGLRYARRRAAAHH